MDQTVEQCMQWCKESVDTHTVVTLNAATIVTMRKDRALFNACKDADLAVADGVPILWCTRLLGKLLPGRVAGVDLMNNLLKQSNREKLKVYLLGGKQHVVRKLVSDIHRYYPGIVIAGFRNGYFSEGQHSRVIERIRRSGAQILFVGMPTPFKEVWCHQHRSELSVPVILGVGGSFDVLAGFVQRAPPWLQKSGLEWLWRLLMEPRRMWKRYLVTNSKFVLIFGAALIKAIRCRKVQDGNR